VAIHEGASYRVEHASSGRLALMRHADDGDPAAVTDFTPLPL
jgi:hypothetical protein